MRRAARFASAWLLTATATVCAQDLQELVVTATREPMPLIDVPGSLTALSATDLALVGGTHHAEAMNRVAGVYIQRGSGQESLTAIRSPVLTGAGACGAFLALEDGLAIRPIGFCNANDLFEVNTEQANSIEILRGPGPAIYGASAVHGIVNVLTPAVAQLPSWGVAGEVGTDDYVSARVAGRLIEGSHDFGAYGLYTHDGGFRADSGFDEGKLNLLYDGSIADGSVRVRAAGTVLNQETAGFIRGFEAYNDAGLAASNANPEAFRDAWSARASAAWQREPCVKCIDDLRFIVRGSRMQFLQHFLLGQPLEDNEQTSATLSTFWERPFSNAVSWRTGFDLETASVSLLESQDGPTTGGSPVANAIRPSGLHYDFEVVGKSAGVFGAVIAQPNERWRISGALRAEVTRYDYDNLMIDGNTDAAGIPCVPGPCLYSRPGDRSDNFRNLAPKIDLTFAPDAEQRLYAAWSRGFRPPEMTELYRLQRQQSVADLESEKLAGAEVGWRGDFSRFSWALAAFALEKSNVILRDASGFNVDGGKTTHRGTEYEFTWRPVYDWRLVAAGSVAWHRYAFSTAIEGGETILDGNDVDTSPRNVHSLRIGYSPGPQLDAEIETLYLGAYWLDAANQHRYSGHTLLNLRATWSPNAAWQLSLRALNLADVSYADRADFAFGEYRYFPGRGRAAFVEIAYRAE